jgi:hypothetical protein
LLGALNQERAREYAGAVCSYEVVLKTGAQLVPAEFIGERLEHLRKTQPDEFKKGMAIAMVASPPKLVVSESRSNTLYDGGACIIDLRYSQGDIAVPAASNQPPKSTAVRAAD